MNIGAMRDQVVILAKSSVSDGIGGFTPSTSTLATIWAEIRELTGQRQTDFEQLVNAKGYEIVVRNRTDINTTHQVELPSGQRLTIHSIQRDFKYKEYMTIVGYA